jgi:hypothetical protein
MLCNSLKLFHWDTLDFYSRFTLLAIFIPAHPLSLTCRYARIFPHSQLLLCNTMEAFGKRKELKHALKVFRALKDQLGGINMFACRSIIDICSHCGSSVQARIIFEVWD